VVVDVFDWILPNGAFSNQTLFAMGELDKPMVIRRALAKLSRDQTLKPQPKNPFLEGHIQMESEIKTCLDILLT
jgi:hypothetical protein